MQKIYVLHENDEWTDPLVSVLNSRGLPFESWFLDEGAIDLNSTPPPGVFYNRMSASSHTRNHRFAPEYTASVLAWLESHGRRVLNPTRALQLEVSKVAQYAALEQLGIAVPHTIAVFGRNGLAEAAEQIGAPFITKHNRAGKGLGVRLFHSVRELTQYASGDEFEEPIDGITLIQQYIEAPDPYITRCEFVGQEFLYAVRVNTSDGFLLCPADECNIDDAPTEQQSKFEIIDGFNDPIIEAYRRVLVANDIHIAGIEFIENGNGEKFTYDINTNTNYNPTAEARSSLSGMEAIGQYLCRELARNGYRGPGVPCMAVG